MTYISESSMPSMQSLRTMGVLWREPEDRPSLESLNVKIGGKLSCPKPETREFGQQLFPRDEMEPPHSQAGCGDRILA